ncbi:MAG: hypothetical protein H7Y36_05480, partial [Armatimonadetes bacterium]|nr:hypothetical protein [Akkermansiaceae bacterium]
MIPESILRRKGSRNTASVPTEVLSLLNQGSLETVNLCEWLVVDQLNLAEREFPKFGWQKLLPTLRERFAKHMPLTAPKKLLLIGSLLAEHFTTPASIRSASQLLLVQPSDIVRSWGAYLIGLNAGLSLNEKLHLIRPYAADPNMSTREIAWLALREATIADLEMSILA